jgi:hypothetical protein
MFALTSTVRVDPDQLRLRVGQGCRQVGLQRGQLGHVSLLGGQLGGDRPLLGLGLGQVVATHEIRREGPAEQRGHECGHEKRANQSSGRHRASDLRWRVPDAGGGRRRRLNAIRTGPVRDDSGTEA